ncbi:Ppx/GppA phosphatase family protein, partial [Candidatus Entotheonella palauensis]|uniref:Ppx/GppA phosphatase family protein n=1 Tax=Candidatus Entotheonella palauensis TaxID=93172 RepID=UPI00277B5C7C
KRGIQSRPKLWTRPLYSTRLLGVRIFPNHSYTVLTQLKHTVRLGEGEFDDRCLQPQAIDRAVLVCQQFATLARTSGAEEIIAVATAATREAKNQRAFLDRLRQEAKLDVRVVSGLEEARLIYLGVASGVHLGDKQGLFVDIGGGSTEIIIGTQHHHRYLNSLKLGAIRLTTEQLPAGDGPVATKHYERLRRYVHHNMVHLVRELRDYHIDLAIGSSGTIENLADVAARMYLERERQPDDVLSRAHLQQLIPVLCSLSLEERRKVPGLNSARADIIIGGAVILQTLMEALGVRSIRVTDRGLRDGLLVDYLVRQDHAPLIDELSVRKRSVLQFGRACQFNEAHARLTAQLALSLFDSGRAAQLHHLGSWERELLEYAALLHHIGAFVTFSNYQAHTYYLIRNAELLGFDQTEIAIMATVALYHRKSLPRKKHPEFAALNKRSQQIVRRLATLLRLAECLDRSQAGHVSHAYFERLDYKQVRLNLYATQDCQIEVWGVEKHLDAFAKVFEHRFDIHVQHAMGEAIQAAALQESFPFTTSEAL